MLYYSIDSPTKPHNIIIPNDSITFRGWMTNAAGTEVQLHVTQPSGKKIITATEKRPDVVSALAEQAPNTPELCGFNFDIHYEELADTENETEKKVTLAFSDGTLTSNIHDFSITQFTSMQWGGVNDIAKQTARADYKNVWNNLAAELTGAKFAVAGYTDDAEFHRTAVVQMEGFEKTVGIKQTDIFLEIGCGIGRIATILADRVAQWIGTDVSENMLKHAADNLKDKNNIKLVPTNGWDLAPIPSNSVDVVYCAVVFMHLDEWERFNYVCEAKRVLKPGGRLFINNFNLLSEEGWQLFLKTLVEYHPMERPPFIGKSSTRHELIAYLTRAGFDSIQTDETGLWVSAWGVLPG